MRPLLPTFALHPWLAGLVTAWAVGCGPLGGCGAPRVQSETAATPEEGHERPVEGAIPAGGAAEGQALAAAEAPAPPPIQLTAEALEARVAGQRATFGKEDLFGEYARGLPSRPSVAVDPSLGSLDALPGSAGAGGSASASAPPAIDGNALGIFVPMQAPAGAMDHFYDALKAVKRGDDDDGKVHVLLYGASHTAADIYPTYLRAYLRERFGDGGPGFVALAKTNKYYRLLAWTLETSKGWVVEHAQKKKAREDGYYGLMGASTSATKKRDVSKLIPEIEGPSGPHKTTYELFFLRQPSGGKFTVKIDGKEQKQAVNTKAKGFEAGYVSYTVDGGPHEVEIRPVGKGEVRVFGMSVEYDTPGVVVDTLGINGTRASNHLKWNEAVWADNFKRRKPDLVVLAYGTNESLDEDVPIGHYKAELRQVLDRIKSAAPEASCLLVGPGDFPAKSEDGAFVGRARTAEIVAAQAEIAAEKGCAFWDALAFMGGTGSMVLWAQSEPSMGRPDHIHLTRRGYVRMGMAITDALMDPFEAGEPASTPKDPLLASDAPATGQAEAIAATQATP